MTFHFTKSSRSYYGCELQQRQHYNTITIFGPRYNIVKYCDLILQCIANYFCHVLSNQNKSTTNLKADRMFCILGVCSHLGAVNISDFFSNFRCHTREEQGLVLSCGLQKQCHQSGRMYQSKIKMIISNK